MRVEVDEREEVRERLRAHRGPELRPQPRVEGGRLAIFLWKNCVLYSSRKGDLCGF